MSLIRTALFPTKRSVVRWPAREAFLRTLFVAVAALSGAHGVFAVEVQDRALSALQARQILPLHEIMARSQMRGDRLLRADLDRDGGRYVYELRVIAADGTVRVRRLDAGTGEALPDGKLSDHPVESPLDENDLERE
ncbi:PepSY domain-containing protein [Methylocapsa aurea]|uniref:PepSY domain-containing protein n=1 Tax=Methylocapsa aurea TaxID=663610 RepID=UPI000691746A|nr:hypothetical protein [Methylocapsa aurea]